MPTPATRTVTLTGLLLAAALALPAPVAAGTYEVRACADAPANANNSWIAVNGDPANMAMGDGCGTTGTYRGLYVREVMNIPGNVPGGTQAWWYFAAPAEARIRSIAYSRYLHVYQNEYWHPELRTDTGQVLDTCTIVYPTDRCTSGSPNDDADAPRTITGLDAAALSVGAHCQPTGGDVSCTRGATIQKVIAVLYRATVTLEDTAAPTASGLSGDLTAGGWQNGTRTVLFTGRDSTGIKRLRLLVDGNGIFSDDKTCNYTVPAPCASPGGDVAFSPGHIDTAVLSDGTYQLRPEALDAGDNASVGAAATVRVDNTAPAAPSVVSHTSSGPDGQVGLSLPPQGPASPLAATWVRVCRQGGTCEPDRRIPGAQTAVNYHLPEQGSYSVHVWLEDEAGNQDSGRSAVVEAAWGVAPQPLPGAGPATGPPAGSGGTSPIPPSGLRPSGLRVDLAALHAAQKSCRRLVVQGRTDPDATGTLTVAAKGRVGRRAYRRTATSALAEGRWKARLALPRLACRRGVSRRVKLLVTYGGDRAFTAGRLVVNAAGRRQR